MVTSSEDGTVKVWDTRTGSLQRNYMHRAPVNDVVIHPNQGELISGDQAGMVRVWDLGESVCTHQLIPAEDTSVLSVSVASDGSLLCAGNKVVGSHRFSIHVRLLTRELRETYIYGEWLSPMIPHALFQSVLSRLIGTI